MNRQTQMGQRGFTLLEVMISLGILFASLAVLISTTADNIRTAERADMLGIATDLTRGKLYDVEEELLHDGFQEVDKEEDGDFSEEGWKQFEWHLEIEKVELPSLGSLESLAGGEGGEGGEGLGFGDSPLAGMLSMGGGDASAAGGASFIASQFELISKVLEHSIRKVTLTVTWYAGNEEETLKTNVYFTDPAAVQQTLLGGLGGAAGGGASGGGTTTGPSGTRGSSSGAGGTKPGIVR